MVLKALGKLFSRLTHKGKIKGENVNRLKGGLFNKYFTPIDPFLVLLFSYELSETEGLFNKFLLSLPTELITLGM